jgi:hypothetical protein
MILIILIALGMFGGTKLIRWSDTRAYCKAVDRQIAITRAACEEAVVRHRVVEEARMTWAQTPRALCPVCQKISLQSFPRDYCSAHGEYEMAS